MRCRGERQHVVAAERPTTVGEVQAYRVPAQAPSSTRQVTPTEHHSVPATSSRGRRTGPAGDRSTSAAAATGTAPSGRFTQKHHRQPATSVNQPPTSGPATDETANAAPSTPV